MLLIGLHFSSELFEIFLLYICVLAFYFAQSTCEILQLVPYLFSNITTCKFFQVILCDDLVFSNTSIFHHVICFFQNWPYFLSSYLLFFFSFFQSLFGNLNNILKIIFIAYSFLITYTNTSIYPPKKKLNAPCFHSF